MANSRTVTLAAALSLAGLLSGTSLAASTDAHRHRHHATPRITVTPPDQGAGGGAWVTYRANPFASYRWFGPGWSVGLGDWGSTPVYYPNARLWQCGNPTDPACNMPSSPCWDQDRE
jgi:hypothetical protein